MPDPTSPTKSPKRLPRRRYAELDNGQEEHPIDELVRALLPQEKLRQDLRTAHDALLDLSCNDDIPSWFIRYEVTRNQIAVEREALYFDLGHQAGLILGVAQAYESLCIADGDDEDHKGDDKRGLSHKILDRLVTSGVSSTDAIELLVQLTLALVVARRERGEPG